MSDECYCVLVTAGTSPGDEGELAVVVVVVETMAAKNSFGANSSEECEDNSVVKTIMKMALTAESATTVLAAVLKPRRKPKSGSSSRGKQRVLRECGVETTSTLAAMIDDWKHMRFTVQRGNGKQDLSLVNPCPLFV